MRLKHIYIVQCFITTLQNYTEHGHGCFMCRTFVQNMDMFFSSSAWKKNVQSQSKTISSFHTLRDIDHFHDVLMVEAPQEIKNVVLRFVIPDRDVVPDNTT